MPGYSRIGGGGGGGAPDAVISDAVTVAETPRFGVTLPADGVSAADSLGAIGLTLTDPVSVADSSALDAGLASLTDSVATSDSVTAFAIMGTSFDTYLDEAADTSSFDTDTTALAKTLTALSSDRKIAYMVWDLTGTDGITASAPGGFSFRCSHNSLGSAPVDFEMYRHTSDPLPSGATWASNEPPAGTLIGSDSVSIPAGAATTQSFTGITASDMNDAIADGYFYVRMLGDTGIGGNLTTFTIDTAEGVTAPIISFEGVIQ